MVELLEPIAEAEVVELLEKTKSRWTAPEPMPGWCCDGVHSDLPLLKPDRGGVRGYGATGICT